MVGSIIETGKPFYGIVTKDELRALKKRLNPTVIYLDNAINGCSSISAGSRAAWKEFAKNWKEFYEKEESFFTVADDYDIGKDYEKDIDNWVKLYSGMGCPIAAPSSPLNGEDGTLLSDKTHNTLQIVAISGAVIAVVVAIRGIIR